MAVLTDIQITAARNICEQEMPLINYSKSQINAALQAVENWFNKAAIQISLSTDIDAAIAPMVLTNAQKKKLVKAWLMYRFGVD